jgi:proteasome alpha subunit
MNVIRALVIAAALVAPAFAQAQSDYPKHPIRILVGFPAGGSTDVLARVLAQEARKALGHSTLLAELMAQLRFPVRAADLKGYAFSREDVDARALANQYAQMLGHVFTNEMKPMEVEILVAEVGVTTDGDQLFHILYDGTVVDEISFSVLGGDAEAISARMDTAEGASQTLEAAVQAATAALSGPDRTLAATDLEVAVLSRLNGRRCFKRLSDDAVAAALIA